ncbi:heme ABC exporter ATP-binding protein CcmA [Undibacterium sp. SXout7W]|uniref:heme ABC exporter ATP-binding protein CcmA n=1 Tax=Undibacterium sp. SXout7W TaxID=3413049 RepID=UPI003BF25504
MTDQNQYLLELTKVPVQRSGRELIKDVSFRLPYSRYIELQGQNGSGKTSLLRKLASMSNGNATTDKGEMKHSPDLSVFYFGHQSGFRPELKITEQLTLSLSMYGQHIQAVQLKSLLQKIGLSHQIHSRIRHLSQGQIRRLMLGIMLHSGCQLWLIDEPLNALDSNGIDLLKELLTQHFQAGGSAIIATHRSLSEAMPAIDFFSSGKLFIDSSQARFIESTPSHTNSCVHPVRTTHVRISMSAVDTLLWIVKREITLTAARPQDMVWPSVFHWMVISLFPFGIGTETEFLTKAAGGIFWISALLATLIGANRFFEIDFEHGALNDMNNANISMPLLVFGKMLSGWLFMGIPLALISIPLGLLYGLGGQTLLVLFISLLLGSVTLTAFSSMFAALGLMARQAQIIVCLLAFPVFVPLIIFGTAAITGAQTGIGYTSPLLVLANLATLSIIALPVITGKVLILALE